MMNPAGVNDGRIEGQVSLPGQADAKAATGRTLIQIRISEQSRSQPSHGICLHCGNRLEKPQGMLSERPGVRL